MSSAVGSISTDIMRGVPSLLKLRVDTWEVPGLDGYGAQTLGNGDGEFDIETVTYFADDADAVAHIVACADAQGTIVTLVDDYGDTYQNILIVRVDCVGSPGQPSKKRVIKDGNPSAMRVRIGWHMMATSMTE